MNIIQTASKNPNEFIFTGFRILICNRCIIFFEKKLKNLKKKLDLPPDGSLRLKVIKLKEVKKNLKYNIFREKL